MFSRQFIVTLPSTPQRLEATMAHLAERGLHPEPFHGLDWRESGLETRWAYEVDNPRSGFRMGSKVVNLFLSHFMLWKACAHLGQADSFLILEDDVRFDADWRAHLAVALQNLPADWDLLYLGSCCTAGREHAPVCGRLHRTEYALCTHAYAVRAKALPALLRGCARVWAPVDVAMLFGAFPWLKVFAILPRIAQQHETELTP